MNILFLFAFLLMYRVISVPIVMKQQVLVHSVLYGPCKAHDDCCEADFCDASSYCSKCEYCHYNADSIDNECPAKCPALCEDKPPQYPKCNICSSQAECDAMYDDGLQEEEEHMLPLCNDDSGRCDPDNTCKNISMDYRLRLEQWYNDWYMENIDEIENLGPHDEPIEPQLIDVNPAGDEFCSCFHNGIQCVAENQCFVPTQEDLEDLKNMPFTMYEWCLDGMKCSNDQCAWAEGLEEIIFGEGGEDYTHNNCAGHDECGPHSFCYNGQCDVCEECHFDWDAIDGRCPDKCPALCQDTPPQFGKCPICESSEECDAMHVDGFQEEEENPWPHCTDGTDRCPISTECEDVMLDYAERLEAWFHQWFEAHPNATEMPSPAAGERPAAGNLSCHCIRVQAECIINNECYTDEDIEHMEELPFTLEEWCSDGMKCDQSNCQWASWQHNGFCHDFVSVKVNQFQRKLQERNVQKEMKLKYNHKKHFHAALKMQKLSSIHQALP